MKIVEHINWTEKNIVPGLKLIDPKNELRYIVVSQCNGPSSWPAWFIVDNVTWQTMAVFHERQQLAGYLNKTGIQYNNVNKDMPKDIQVTTQYIWESSDLISGLHVQFNENVYLLFLHHGEWALVNVDSGYVKLHTRKAEEVVGYLNLHGFSAKATER